MGDGVISCTVLPRRCRFQQKKDHQDRTKNAKVMRFQNFPNFGKNFTQFLGYRVCWGENYGEVKKFFPKKFCFGKKIFWANFYFSKISLGGIFIINSLYPYKFHLH